MAAARAVAVLVSLVLAACAPPGDAIPDAATRAMGTMRSEEIRAHMAFLADDLLEGRDTGTTGYDIAAKYVQTQFEAMGLEPAGDGDSFYQQVPLRVARIVEQESSFVLVDESGRSPLRYGRDYTLDPPLVETASTVEGPLVFVGYAISAPELDYDDYDGLDVNGKIVVALSGAPERFASTERAVYSSRATKAQQAVEMGAVGLVLVNSPTDEARRPWNPDQGARPSMTWIDQSSDRRATARAPLTVARLSHAAASDLLAMGPHSLQDIFDTIAGDEPPRFSIGVRAVLEASARHEDLESPNVVARLAGTNTDESVVYSAHLDHVGRGRPDGEDDIYNGAYDNASGVAVLLALARAFTHIEAAPERTIVFIAVTAEEKGLLGSDYFSRHPTPRSGEIVANINVDGALMFHPLLDIVPFGAEHSSLLEPVAQAAEHLNVTLSPDFMPEEVVFVRSDQYSFVRQGVPAVYPFVGTETGNERIDGERVIRDWMAERYHTPSDDMTQEMDFVAGGDYARLCFLLGYLVANADERPTWNEGDFLGTKFAR